MKLFIADDINEFEQMLGKEYHFKVDALERFKTGSMCIINYGALFNMNDIEELNKTQPNVYTTENGDDFQAVFVYNNSSKELNLKPNQFIEDKDEIEPAHFDETFTQNGIPYTFNKQPQDRRMRNMSDRMRMHEARPSE